MDIADKFTRSSFNENPYFIAGTELCGVGMSVALLCWYAQIASLVLRRNQTLIMEIAPY